MTISDLLRWMFTMMGAVVAILQPTAPYLIICTIAIFYDCYTAWSLGRRVAKAHPSKARTDAHKFNSHHFGHVIMTLIKTYAIIVLAFLIERHITSEIPVDMTKVAAGAICFWQIWSILENESSCNGAKWAKIAQKIMVDKTSRHFDIDFSDLKSNAK